MTTIPNEPGIYPGLSFDDYKAIRALNQSTLKVGLPPRTMAHLKAELDEPKEQQSKFMSLGSICHSGVFEPLDLLERYAVMPEFEKDAENVTKDGKPTDSKVTSYYKQRKSQWEHDNEGRTPLGAQSYECYRRMMVNLKQSKRARERMTGGEAEVTIIWRDKCGPLCKGRIDYLRDEVGHFTDYKTLEPRSVLEPWRPLVNWDIDFQLAFYRRGLWHNTGRDFVADLVLQENASPFLVRAAPAEEAALNTMDDRIEALLLEVDKCQRSGFWPGWEGDEVFTVPEWRLNTGGEQLELEIGGEKIGV